MLPDQADFVDVDNELRRVVCFEAVCVVDQRSGDQPAAFLLDVVAETGDPANQSPEEPNLIGRNLPTPRQPLCYASLGSADRDLGVEVARLDRGA